MAGGGVASDYDPLDVTQYTEPEIRAAVDAAENWGTYVTVHAYTPRAVRAAIAAGVRCIEHGQLLDEETVALMAENGIWWCLQPFLDDEDAPPLAGPNRAKFLQMAAGTDNAYRLAIKHQVHVAFGTDTLFDAKLATRQGAQLAKLTRWYSPADVLQQATAGNAELLALSGRGTPTRTARRRRGRSHRRPDPRRRQPGRGHLPDRPAPGDLPRHHQGRTARQRHGHPRRLLAWVSAPVLDPGSGGSKRNGCLCQQLPAWPYGAGTAVIPLIGYKTVLGQRPVRTLLRLLAAI